MNQPLAERIRTGDSERRFEALLEAMEQAPDDVVVAAVVEALDAEHPGLRQAALEAVGLFVTTWGATFDMAVLDRTVQLTLDPSGLVRAEAASTLAQLCDDVEHAPRLQALRRMLRDDEAGVRHAAAAALGDLRDADSAETLATLLDDDDAQLRFEAAFALASLGDARARPHLERALGTRRLRLDAMKALGTLGDEASIDPLERFAARWFIDWVDRLTVYATLYRLGRRSYAEKILARTSSRNIQERTYAVALIGSHTIEEGAALLVSLAEDPAAPLRETAIDALGALGKEEHAPVLERITEDESVETTTRRVAQDALRKLGGVQGRGH